MTKEHEFKTWLEQGGAQTEAGRNSRAYAIRTIERNLAALGMPHRDIDEAWEADRFESLRERLRKMREDARAGGQDYRILMPGSDTPHNRLSSWGSWVGQYGRFLAGDPPGAGKDADRIRQYVLEHYIEPARDEGRDHVEVLVRDVNKALGLKEAWPNICQALGGQMFQDMALISEPERSETDQSSATVFRFKLDETAQSGDGRPFVLFDATGAPYQPVRNFNRTTGVSAFRIKPRGVGNKADEVIETEDIVDVARAMLVDGLPSGVKAIARGGLVNYLTYGGDKLVRYELAPEIAQAIGVPPRGGVDGTSSVDEGGATRAETQKELSSMNLILYGPPGTGKTFATAAEAVRLCGEPVPEDRAQLMEVYQRLLAAGRIEFVTFHQSMSYEDFIEGRQPMTGSDGDEGSETAGFRLETVHGIFRRIAKRAETSRGPSSGSGTVTLEGRQVFKMSIGRANVEEDAQFFEEAIKGGYTLLGWENIDWSDERYAEASEILETCQKEGTIPGAVNAQSGQVQHTDVFRNRMKVGDIIIVSKGNSLFRAIGEVTGEYDYSPRPEADMCHRRPVKWLWVDAEGVLAKEIYQSNFTQATIYRLKKDSLNIPALERYINSGRSEGPTTPEPFVLIIDEINRANISKVFGELITLLEPDKRLNQPNALRVRLPYSGDEFGVPSNLHVLGTMNTADRSIALLDTALRRRFTFREMMPDASVLEEAAQKCGIDLPRLLATINERIEYLYDREHQIGHAYFTTCSSRHDVDEVMRHKVIPLLAEYFFEDWGKIAAVLGDLEPHDGPISGGFLKRSALKAPPGLEDGDAVPRFRWQVRAETEGFDYEKLAGT